MRTEREFLIDVLGRLERAQIDCMLTGSMASNYWGIPRTTHDLDFVIALRPEQVDRIVKQFEHGFFVQPSAVRGVFRPPFQFKVLDQQSALKADFWQLRDSEFEQEMFRRRITVSLFDTNCSIATAEDVVLHKLYWSRLNPSERQKSDAAGIYEVQGDRLDLDYLRSWANQLGVAEDVSDLVSGRLRSKST